MPEPYYGEAELLGWSNRSYKRRRERQRVAELNAALSRLKRLVPSVRELPFPNRGRGHDRLTKVGILRAAVDYIRDMRETLRTDVLSKTVLQEGKTEEEDSASLSQLCVRQGLDSTQHIVCEPSSPPREQKMDEIMITSDVIPPDWRVTSTTSN